MALVSLDTYYSFPNTDSTNNNFGYSPDNGTTWFNIDIPEGSYEITGALMTIMRENGHYDSVNDEYYITIKANSNTLKSVLDIGTNHKVDLTTTNSVRTVLGFNEQIYSEGYNESDNIVNILSVTTLRVTSDIIWSSFTNGDTKNIIYSFFPKVVPAYKTVQEPLNLPITLNTISHMETKLEDQNGN